MSTQPADRVPVRSFRVDDDLWARFSTAIDQVPEAGISMILRQFLRWYVGDPGAKLPERPIPIRNLGVLDPGVTITADPGELTTWSE